MSHEGDSHGFWSKTLVKWWCHLWWPIARCQSAGPLRLQRCHWSALWCALRLGLGDQVDGSDVLATKNHIFKANLKHVSYGGSHRTVHMRPHYPRMTYTVFPHSSVHLELPALFATPPKKRMYPINSHKLIVAYYNPYCSVHRGQDSMFFGGPRRESWTASRSIRRSCRGIAKMPFWPPVRLGSPWSNGPMNPPLWKVGWRIGETCKMLIVKNVVGDACDVWLKSLEVLSFCCVWGLIGML